MKVLPLILQATTVSTALAICAGLAGCASHGTLTQGTLFMDTQKAVIAADQSVAPDCRDRHVVTTEVVDEPDVVVTPMPGTTSASFPHQPVYLGQQNVADPGERRFTKAVERWTVERCGAQVRYLVTLMPDDAGGTSISVKPEG